MSGKYKIAKSRGRYCVLGPGMEAHEVRGFLFEGDAQAYLEELEDLDRQLEDLGHEEEVEEEEEDEDEAAAEELDKDKNKNDPPVEIHPGGDKK